MKSLACNREGWHVERENSPNSSHLLQHNTFISVLGELFMHQLYLLHAPYVFRFKFNKVFSIFTLYFLVLFKTIVY